MAIGIFNGNWKNMWKPTLDDVPSQPLELRREIEISIEIAKSMKSQTMFPNIVVRGTKTEAELNEQLRILDNITFEEQLNYELREAQS